MNLTDYPTPETDAVNSGEWESLEIRYDLMHDLAEDLERRLAAARDTLDQIRDRAMDQSIKTPPDADAKGCVDDIWEWAEQALELTAPAKP